MEDNKVNQNTQEIPMDYRLVNFLSDKGVEKDQPFTHVSKIKPMYRYFLDGDNLDKFYQIYNQVISEGRIAGIAEKPEEVVPLIVDVDLKFPLEKGLVRQYKQKHIRELITIYQNIIREIAKDCTEKMLICCVLEKTSPVFYKDYVKDGFHLHFPFFYSEHWVQKGYIRNQLLKQVAEKEIFSDLTLLESLDKIFDKNIPSNVWLMYGSRKEPKAEAYKITKYYNHELEVLNLKSVFKTDYEGTKEWNLPRYLSIRVGAKATPININPPTVIKEKLIEPEFKRNPAEISAFLSEHVEKLVDLLSSERASDYNSWMKVGWCLYNISEGHSKALEMWKTFSANSPKYQEAECEKIWNKITTKEEGLGMGSLLKWAEEDSPQEFAEYKQLRFNKQLEDGLSMAHNDIAKILHYKYKDRYVCADVEKEVWYEFKNHRWRRSSKGIDLRMHLSHEIANEYLKMLESLAAKARNSTDESIREMHTKKLQKISKLVEKLKNSSFKNAVMKEAIEYFYDEKFIEKMDENYNLLVFENGVYDAELINCKKCSATASYNVSGENPIYCYNHKEDKMVNVRFRPGKPSDYCTKSTGVYYKEFSKWDPSIQDLMAIFKTIFVNPKLLKFFKQTVSDLVRGGNRHKIFTIWTGEGDNGKSICADLIKFAFGDYYYTPPTTMLTGKQSQSSSATAELLPCKGARVVVISETDNDDVLNCGTMKKLTGGDPFYARGLFKEPIEIVPYFKLILHCNKLPNVSAEDKASWNRIRVLPFESIFPKNKDIIPASIEEQYAKKIFPRDNTLRDKLPKLAEAFIWWLIKEYEEIGNAELYEPEEVKTATDIYQKTNDFYMQFLDERIQETGNKKDFISLTVVYTLFKEWYKDSFPGRKIPNREMVKEALEKKLGKQEKGIWKGVTTFDPESMADGGDS